MRVILTFDPPLRKPRLLHFNMASEGEVPLLQVHNVRHKKKDGMLVLTSARVAWCQGDSMDNFVVNHPYNLIRAQRISAEGHSRVQLQLILHANNTQVNFHFTGADPKGDRDKVKQILQEQLPKFSQVNPEIEAKTNLLKSDPALYQLYNDLVVSRLISAEEFWANRFSEGKLSTAVAGNGGGVKGQSAKPGEEQQEIGLPSAFLADVQVQFDGCNKAKYNITTDAIEAIFKTYPSVKAKHMELVPEKMAEEEFWLQFFQSQLFHRDSLPGSNSKKNFFTDVLMKEQKSMAERTKLNGTSVKLNSTETSKDALGESGYSVLPDIETSSSSALPLLQRCNYHSNMVLRAILNEYDPETSTNASSSGTSSDSASSLKLTPSQHTQETNLPGTSILSLAQQMAAWNTQQLTVDPLMAQSAIASLVPGGQLMTSSGCVQGDGASLSQEQQSMLFRHQAAVAELLRHFWSCFPARTPQLEEKAHKMYQCLQEYKDSRLSELVTSFSHSDLEQRTVDHLRATIAAALDHYHMWQARRNSQFR